MLHHLWMSPNGPRMIHKNNFNLIIFAVAQFIFIVQTLQMIYLSKTIHLSQKICHKQFQLLFINYCMNYVDNIHGLVYKPKNTIKTFKFSAQFD